MANVLTATDSIRLAISEIVERNRGVLEEQAELLDFVSLRVKLRGGRPYRTTLRLESVDYHDD